MKRMALMVVMSLLVALLPAVLAHAEPATCAREEVSSGQRSAVRMPQRITVQARENADQVDVRVSSLARCNDTVAVSVNNALTRRANGGSVFNTVIPNDRDHAVYTIVLP